MWNSILGHQHNKIFLEKYLHAQARPHALLFYGEEGLGKCKLAMLFAKSLLCFNHAEQDNCESCRLLNSTDSSTGHPDFIYLRPEEGSKNIKIDQVKEILKQGAFAPVLSQNKVCIIDGADKMTVDAANSFLKLLEEPPAGWIFILIATAEAAVLPTVLSRVIKIKFTPLAAAEVAQVLKSQGASAEEAEVIARISEGSVGKAISLYEQEILVYRNHALALLEALWLSEPINYLDGRKWLNDYTQEEAVWFVKLLQLLCRDMLLIKLEITANLYNTDILEKLREIAYHWSVKSLKSALLETDSAYRALTGNTSKKMVLDALIIKINDLRKE